MQIREHRGNKSLRMWWAKNHGGWQGMKRAKVLKGNQDRKERLKTDGYPERSELVPDKGSG
jgi:hypothetical protein